MEYTSEELRTIIKCLVVFYIVKWSILASATFDFLVFLTFPEHILNGTIALAVPFIFLLDTHVEYVIMNSSLPDQIEQMRNEYDDDY